MAVFADVNSSYTEIVTWVFSSTIAAKAWLASAAVVLVIVQVLTASRMWGRIGRLLPFEVPAVARVHRWSGRLAFVFTLPVFFHCVFILGFKTTDWRVALHAVVGSVLYGIFAAKVLVIRARKATPAESATPSYPHWVLPVLGGTLAAALMTLWLTSSLWYFTKVRFGF